MKPRRLRAVGALVGVVAVAAGVAADVGAAGTNPSATVAQAAVAGTPAAIACGGFVDAQVTITGHAGTVGTATDVELVLDLSGSMGNDGKLVALQAAATATLDALDAADGTVNQSIAGNRVGIVTYKGSSANPTAPLGSTYSALSTAVSGLTTGGGSPHNLGIDTARAALGSGPGKAIVLITDGEAADTLLDATTNAASSAKGLTIGIVPVGIAADPNGEANLKTWASDTGFYQSGKPGTVNGTKLVQDLGALVSTPASFAVTATLGANFTAAPLSASDGTATTGSGTGALQWTGTLNEGQTATLTYRATRNGNDVFSVTNETVSTLAATVTGGTATVTPPAAITTDVLPCGGSLLASTTCTGASCSAGGTQGGLQYTANVGAPPAGTSVVVTGLSTAPPAGVCPGFDALTNGTEFDIRPLTADATFQIVIPKATLGSKKWWQTQVCLGTNMKFTTALNSLANLRPGATLVGGGALPGRWWGLLPSIPRLTFISGLGWVWGPWITSRSQDSAGNAVVKYKVPYLAGSQGFTTDLKTAYDPKMWGG